jgi:hypothetical protein
MRSGTIGFLVGAIFVLLGVLFCQLWVIRDAAGDLDYRFAQYVFSGTKFPWSYLDQGRALDRLFFPVRITTTFYDAKYHEVTEAAQPGRYGAVVRLELNGGVVQYRFITLYRTPEQVYWDDGATPATASAQFPPGIGVDPAVLQKQGGEISDMINYGFFGEGRTFGDCAGRSACRPADQRLGSRRRLVVRPAPAVGPRPVVSLSRRSSA